MDRETSFGKGGAVPYSADENSFIVIGTGRTISEWENVFAEDSNMRHSQISSWAKEAASTPEYGLHHRYVPDRNYQVHLLFVRDLPTFSKWTTSEIKVEARRRYGKEAVDSLKAELAFLLRLRLLDDYFLEKSISRIIVPHEPLCVYGEQCWFRVDNYDGARNVGTESVDITRVGLDMIWDDDVAFAFARETSKS